MIKARQRGLFVFCLLQRKEQIRGEVGGEQTGGLVGIQQTLVLEEAVRLAEGHPLCEDRRLCHTGGEAFNL